MRAHISIRRLPALAAVTAAAVLWCTGFVPVQLGGDITVMAVSGISMEPHIHAGELVVLRKDSSPGVGDVAAYYNTDAKANFLHRIVARREGGYVFKGDNLQWEDPGVAAPSRLKGVLWFKVPLGGSVMRWLQVPSHGSALAIAGLLATTAGKGSRRRRRRRRPPVRRPHSLAIVALAAAGMALVCVAVAVLALRSPGPAPGGHAGSAYTHTVTFAYSAPVKPSVVYPKGIVSAADPMFPSLVHVLNAGFAYTVDSPLQGDLHGTAGLSVRLESDTGWKRTIVIRAPQPFTGRRAAVRGRLDLDGLRRLIDAVNSLTGVAGSYTATLEASVRLRGTLNGATVDDEFPAELPIAVTAPAPGPGSSLTQSADRGLPGAPAKGGARDRRRLLVAVGGALLFSAVSGAAWTLIRRGATSDDEPTRIAARYGRMLTRLAAHPAPGAVVLDVASMEDLVRIARPNGSQIFHHADPESGVEYLTWIDGTAHRYTSRPAEATAGRPAS